MKGKQWQAGAREGWKSLISRDMMPTLYVGNCCHSKRAAIIIVAQGDTLSHYRVVVRDHGHFLTRMILFVSKPYEPSIKAPTEAPDRNPVMNPLLYRHFHPGTNTQQKMGVIESRPKH